ncbi:phosphatidylserine synthase 2-like [Patiria miniata]|uniref:Phosphatidylserine synthase n=1 Tax=Patiria miniata TaxID=46514 RepID=A0A913ZLC6_PATMI|nr:phosphatidylserine synthase 2-like [Patiria miniata]XP_038051860.1 phosphatidylserine synthase 2-like [Patiria miniata]XP_038051868.1 phosphatidylserine synthase 2-like [Patiria miniata]
MATRSAKESVQPVTRDGSLSSRPSFSSFLTNVEDDGTMTYFWRAHSITALIFLIASLLYVSLFEDQTHDVSWNVKRGIVACVVVFCIFGMTQVRDGPFRRPHPAFWRLVVCLSVLYELALVFLLFQTVDNARQLMAYLDPELGKPLPEQSYAEDCRIYDPDGHPDGPWHNLWEKMDIFVVGHLVGWFFKMLMIRDYWVCWVISIMFEFLEYSLEHQLPNFAECWWDHWILDVLVCNGAGIWLGMKTLNYLNIKTYQWRGLWKISTYRGKLKRIFLQFTPYSWTRFDWQPTANLTHWLAVLGIISMYLLAELNTFYLKYILWIPPPHLLNWLRLVLYVLVGSCALRELFQYMSDPECKTMGQQSWVMSAIIFTEFLIALKFDLPLILKPFPRYIAICWILGILAVVSWTVWNFCIHRISFRFLHWTMKKPKSGNKKEKETMATDDADGCEVDDHEVSNNSQPAVKKQTERPYMTRLRTRNNENA